MIRILTQQQFEAVEEGKLLRVLAPYFGRVVVKNRPRCSAVLAEVDPEYDGLKNAPFDDVSKEQFAVLEGVDLVSMRVNDPSKDGDLVDVASLLKLDPKTATSEDIYNGIRAAYPAFWIAIGFSAPGVRFVPKEVQRIADYSEQKFGSLNSAKLTAVDEGLTGVSGIDGFSVGTLLGAKVKNESTEVKQFVRDYYQWDPVSLAAYEIQVGITSAKGGSVTTGK